MSVLCYGTERAKMILAAIILLVLVLAYNYDKYARFIDGSQ